MESSHTTYIWTALIAQFTLPSTVALLSLVFSKAKKSNNQIYFAESFSQQQLMMQCYINIAK